MGIFSHFVLNNCPLWLKSGMCTWPVLSCCEQGTNTEMVVYKHLSHSSKINWIWGQTLSNVSLLNISNIKIYCSSTDWKKYSIFQKASESRMGMDRTTTNNISDGEVETILGSREPIIIKVQIYIYFDPVQFHSANSSCIVLIDVIHGRAQLIMILIL